MKRTDKNTISAQAGSNNSACKNKITVWIENSSHTSFTIQFEAVNKTFGKIAATAGLSPW